MTAFQMHKLAQEARFQARPPWRPPPPSALLFATSIHAAISRSGSVVKRAYLPVEIFAPLSKGENTTACLLTQRHGISSKKERSHAPFPALRRGEQAIRLWRSLRHRFRCRLCKAVSAFLNIDQHAVFKQSIDLFYGKIQCIEIGQTGNSFDLLIR